MRSRTALATVIGAIVMVTVVGVVAAVLHVRSDDSSGSSASTASAAPSTTSPSGTTASATDTSGSSASPTTSRSCVTDSSWDCAQQARLADASDFLKEQPGDLAIIVHDRTTGAVWSDGTTTDTTWASSTIKLAMVATILEWDRAGKVTIDDETRANMADALVDSSDQAANTLWYRYGGQPMFHRFRSTYGMTSLSVAAGYELFWTNLRCNAEDLHSLMGYVLSDLHLDDRTYIMEQLRGVSGDQRWGVWAAGTNLRPGNKNGWAEKTDDDGTHWVTHSVGFAGPSAQYIIVVTYDVPPSGTLSDGIHTVSDLVATTFGAPVPAGVSIPS